MNTQINAFYPDYITVTCNEQEKQPIQDKKEVFSEKINFLNWALKAAKDVKKVANTDCITGVTVGYCENDHAFMKPIFCKKESCSYCGQYKSPAHMERVGSVLDGVESWSAISYLVITVPSEIRPLMHSKEKLNKFRTFIRRKLKRDGFNTGVLRWHWAGECEQCQGKPGQKESCLNCEGTGAGMFFNPHLNILLPAGNTRRKTKGGKDKPGVTVYVEGQQVLKKDYLDAWRHALATWFRENFNKVVTVGNLRHRFIGARAQDRKKRVRHLVRYVMRATLRNPYLARVTESLLFRFKNTTHLGVWKKTEKEATPCPCCQRPLRWFSEPKDKFSERFSSLVEIKTGMYYINFAGS